MGERKRDRKEQTERERERGEEIKKRRKNSCNQIPKLEMDYISTFSGKFRGRENLREK